jgi:hypothetical protein
MSQDSPGDLGGVTVGSRVGKYLIEEQVGRGGMAAVFRARDQELGRVVALKVLAPALAADEGFRQRFVRESRAAAAVDDPHIIPLHEAGQDGSVLFIAMRYVSGGDVRSLLFRAGGVLTPEQVVAIVSPVSSALDAAHSTGLVHRDVKPANMLLDSAPGRPDHVYLSDFGLSKEAAGSGGLTGTGLFLGTVDYAAPEQIEGRPVDGRTDQYALGCAAFEMLSGAPPFRRDHGLAVLAAHLSQAPPRLSELRPGLPPGLDTVFAKVLAKSPDDRYRTCGEFGDALREVLGLGRYDAAPRAGRQQTELAWNAYPAPGAVPYPVSQPPAVPAGAIGYGPVNSGDAPTTGHIVPGFGSQPSSPGPQYPAAWVNTGPQPQARPGPARWPIAVAAGAIAVAVVVAAIIVVAKAGSATSSSNTAASGGTTVTVTQSASSSPAPSSTSAPTPATVTQTANPSVNNSPEGNPLPASTPAVGSESTWTPIEEPGEFSIEVPPGWTQQLAAASDQVQYGDSAGFSVVVDWTAWQTDPVTHQQQVSETLASSRGSAYQQISIRTVQFDGYDTADWLFTDYKGDEQIESIDRAFVVGSGSTYAVELFGPVGQFQSVYNSVWPKMLGSFNPQS